MTFSPATETSSSQRLVPFLCAVGALAIVLLICLKIIAYGYIPGGDARRHTARAFTNKPFRDIVVMKSFYVVDQSGGWEGLLRLIQRSTGCGIDALMSFSVAVLLGLLLAAPMVLVRRPEAWLGAILAELIAIPQMPSRWTQGRPFLLTETILICLLFAWGRPGVETGRADRRFWLKIGATFAALTLSVWMHGAWYLWLLLPAAFVPARRWREAAWLTGCWAAACVAGACLTGRPAAFLEEQVLMANAIRAEHIPARLLVGEFQPSEGEYASLALLALVYLWGVTRRSARTTLAEQPVFWLLLIGWALGFYADRFWADWGLPAGLVWMAMQFDEAMSGWWGGGAGRRFLAFAAIALPLYLDSTNDLDQRYTACLRETFLDANAPELRGWMPGPGGVFYSAQMRFFYNTFYKNPRGDWKYILGFEPALMPEDDLRIFRRIQLENFAAAAYEPWVRKLRPIDRLEIESGTKPDLPELEWKRAGGTMWIGRPRVAPEVMQKQRS